MTRRDGERTRWTDEMLDELADSVSELRESVSEVRDSVDGVKITGSSVCVMQWTGVIGDRTLM
ncbi:MAG: hypothetical protein RPG89_15240 [Microcystis panniformis WG22]|nr:hypothetical protein [Microcystis panniformis WG22]